MSQWEAGRVPAGIDDAFKLVAFAKGMGVQIPEVSTEAFKAGVTKERRDLTKPGRRAPDTKAYAMKGGA
jgi:hypothetical protein